MLDLFFPFGNTLCWTVDFRCYIESVDSLEKILYIFVTITVGAENLQNHRPVTVQECLWSGVYAYLYNLRL